MEKFVQKHLPLGVTFVNDSKLDPTLDEWIAITSLASCFSRIVQNGASFKNAANAVGGSVVPVSTRLSLDFGLVHAIHEGGYFIYLNKINPKISKTSAQRNKLLYWPLMQAI